MVLEKTLESPLDSKGLSPSICHELMGQMPSNQSILKEISPEYSLEGLMLKLMLQYPGHILQRTDTLEKTLKAKGEGEWQRDG